MSLRIHDDQWDRIKDLLPGRQGSVGVTAKDNRLFVEADLYRWRDLPERFGDFRVVHTRFSCWSRSGVWQRIFETLSQDSDNEYSMLDSTIIRTHQHSAGDRQLLCPTLPVPRYSYPVRQISLTLSEFYLFSSISSMA